MSDPILQTADGSSLQPDWDALAARIAAYHEATGGWGVLDDWLTGGGPDQGDAPGSIRLGGEVAEPGAYTVGELRGLPAETQTVTYGTGRGPVTNTYTGVLLADLIADAGGVTTDPAARNDILAHYVVATGADGYRAVFSLGEIEPRFGDEPIAVAYADGAGELGPDGTAGLARMVVPGDAFGGRYVFDLVGLDVGAGPAFVPGPGGPSTGFALGGAVANPAVFDGAALAALDGQLTQTVTYTSGSGQVTDTYTGVLLWDLLEDAGVLTDPAVRNDLLGFYAVATGSDGYRAVYSLGEIAPGSGGEPIMVAYDDTLGQLGPDGTAGFAHGGAGRQRRRALRVQSDRHRGGRHRRRPRRSSRPGVGLSAGTGAVRHPVRPIGRRNGCRWRPAPHVEPEERGSRAQARR